MTRNTGEQFQLKKDAVRRDLEKITNIYVQRVLSPKNEGRNNSQKSY